MNSSNPYQSSKRQLLFFDRKGLLNKIRTLLILVMLLFGLSCSDFLTYTPVDEVSDANWWKDMSEFEMFINGAYNEFKYGWASGTAWPKAGNHPLGDFTEKTPVFYETYFDPNFGNHWVMWEFHYRVVNKMNTVLYKLPLLEDHLERRRIEAEARFLRGFCFLMLHRAFGKIKIQLLPPDSSNPRFYARDSEEEVLAQIIEDLTMAVDSLPEDYNEWKNLDYHVGRPLKGTALAYRMLAHMYNEDYVSAIEDFEAIEQCARGYELIPNYRDVFALASENSVESFFEIQYLGPVAAFGRPQNTQIYTNQTFPAGEYSQRFVKPGGYPMFVISPEFANSFEPGDERREKCIIGAGESFVGELFEDGLVFYFDEIDTEPITGYLCTKYWIGLEENINLDGSNLNLVQMRYADAVLNYSECLAREGDIAGAYAQLNRIRARAKIDPISGTNLDQFFDDLTTERRHECFAESNVWFDLLRMGTAKQVLAEVYNVEWDSKWALLPVPQGEINTNNDMEQNPGY